MTPSSERVVTTDESTYGVERDGVVAAIQVRGRTVPIEGALPGERVRVTIAKHGRGKLVAKVVEIVERSPDRVIPRCAHFGVCGGCDWQDLGYEAQLQWKRDFVARAVGNTDVRPTVPCAREYEYRNKMEFSFGTQRWLTDEEVRSGAEIDRGFALGLFVPGRFDRVLDLRECHLQSQHSSRLVNRVREVARENSIPAWDARSHQGYLRHLAIREPRRGLGGPEIMVNLVTSRRDETALSPFTKLLRAEFPAVATFVNTIHGGVAQTTVGQECDVVFGAGVVHDHLGDLRFEIAPTAFFQTNTEQAERLYSIVAEFAAITPSDRVFDLFCGVGTISLYVARRAGQVVGVELSAESIKNAEANARNNAIENVVFETGDLLEALPRAVARHGRPDVVILDPPRAGVHPKALRAILELGAPRVVYVSCNPKTLGNDLAVLRRDYRIDAIQPVDMFPQTTHVETVVALTKMR